MKQLLQLLAACLLLTGPLHAQTTEMRHELNHIFQLMDKSQVPSGYLDEFGVQFVDKTFYNGVLADSRTYPNNHSPP
ncbi:MAG: hypothetical protein EAY75_01610 [Bacteroidetes bacterium]|nr:MAG: hypothetical protein EAY75_01610 [Bacteroidota bacterium]